MCFYTYITTMAYGTDHNGCVAHPNRDWPRSFVGSGHGFSDVRLAVPA